MPKPLKEHTGKITAAGTVIALIAYVSTNFASKDLFASAYEKTVENERKIKVLEDKNKTVGAILCGMAMDMKLPSAKENCKDIITNN